MGNAMYEKSLIGEQKRSKGRVRKKNRRPATNGKSTSAPNHSIKYGFYSPGTANSHGIPYAQPKPKKGIKIAPWKIILSIILIGGFGIFYLTHVFNTRQLLQEVQQLERQHQQVERMNEEYRLQYQRLTGPSNIYDKAEQMGFIHGGPADRILTLQKD